MANTTLQFRLATPDDAPRIQQLIQAAFQAEDSRKDWTADMELGRSYRIDVDEILPKIVNDDSEILLAIDEAGAIFACVAVLRREGTLARLALLAVEQSHTQGGVGRRVIANAEEYCKREWGTTKFGLNALSTRRELISWYGRCGYRETGEVTPFPVEKVHGRENVVELVFVELEKEVGGI